MSIDQCRVGYRDASPYLSHFCNYRVSIDQCRVGYRDAALATLEK